MKVKYFKPDILSSMNPPIITVGQIVQAYMPVDRTDIFNPFNMVYEPIPTTENFNKTFEECSMEAAKNLWQLGKPIELFWSGGIDSSGALIALLETKSDTDVLNIRYTQDSIDEFPLMWERLVKHRNDPLSSKEMLTNDLFENHDIIKITGECGDQCFGSDALHKNLHRHSDDWESIFTWDKDEIFHFIFMLDGSVPPLEDHTFQKKREALAEVLFEHVDNAPIEIKTIFDIYWWMNFCFKWQDVDSRMIFTFSTTSEWKSTLSFFNTQDFQRWSITNHDIKHGGTWETYKQPAKEYINKYVKDETYRKDKTKEPSLIKILKNSIDGEYNYEYRQKRRNSPDRIKFVLDDGRYWRQGQDIPEDVFTSCLSK